MKEEVQLADFQREMDMSGDIGEEKQIGYRITIKSMTMT